jgi:protein disulfide-isomerase A1
MYSSVSDKVTIAKIDATANDVPDDIAGFPAIKLFPAGSKDSPIEYSGGRTVEEFVTFVKENGKYQIDVSSNATEDEDVVMSNAGQETLARAAPAATTSEGPEKQGVGASIVSEAVEAAKTMLADTDEGGVQEHDEL